MVRSRTQSSVIGDVSINYRDYRVLFPPPTSHLWVDFATRLRDRIKDRDDLKTVGNMLSEFIAVHPSLAWTNPFIEFRKRCWVDHDTDRFFPKNDYVINGKGKAKTIEVRALFPNLFAQMHTTAEEIDGFLECIIP